MGLLERETWQLYFELEMEDERKAIEESKNPQSKKLRKVEKVDQILERGHPLTFNTLNAFRILDNPLLLRVCEVMGITFDDLMEDYDNYMDDDLLNAVIKIREETNDDEEGEFDKI